MCELIDIKWERVFLHLTLKVAANEKLILWYRDEEVPLAGDEIAPGVYHCVINITAAIGRRFLGNGSWRIGVQKFEYKNELSPAGQTDEVSDELGQPCIVASELAYRLSDFDRVFRYGGNHYAYTVTFEPYLTDQETLSIYLNVRFMRQNNQPEKRRPFFEAQSFIGAFKRLWQEGVKKFLRLLYILEIHVFPKRGNTILLMSETRPALWGNLQAIDERLRERGLDQRFKIRYSFRIAVGKRNSNSSWFKVLKAVATSDIIIVDDYVPMLGYLPLDKNTKLIQVWHAGLGFKAVGYCRFGKNGSPYPYGSPHKQYTFALAPSVAARQVFEEVFAIEREAVVPLGMPRLDTFSDPKKQAATRQAFFTKYPQTKGKRLFLFAPTYRGIGQKTAYYDFDKLDFERLSAFLGEDSVLLIKMHPFIKEHPPIGPYENIWDFSDYPNINDLYLVADVLITDYSSAYYEFSMLKKPILFYVYDKTVYEITRGVHQYIEDSAPGKVCNTFDELMGALEHQDYDFEKTQQFAQEQFALFDGAATDRVIDALILNEEKD